MMLNLFLLVGSTTLYNSLGRRTSFDQAEKHSDRLFLPLQRVLLLRPDGWSWWMVLQDFALNNNRSRKIKTSGFYYCD